MPPQSSPSARDDQAGGKLPGSLGRQLVAVLSSGVLMVAVSVAVLRESFSPTNEHGCPDWIDEEGRQFLLRNITHGIPRLRAAELSSAEFKSFVRQGKPIVVEGALRSWPTFGSLNCSQLASRYPEVEYHDWQVGVRMRVSDIEDRRQGGWRCAAGYMEQADEEWTVNQKAFSSWMKGFREPSFMPKNAFSRHAEGILDARPVVSAFLGQPGTGVSPHLDENCESFMTIQLSGVKQWTVAWPELDPNNDEPLMRWSDPALVVLNPGDVLFWYVSQRHHTEVLQNCSLSLSLQFRHPAPSDYLHELRKMLDSVSKEKRYDIYRQTAAFRTDYIRSCDVVTDTNGDSFISYID